jgi:hypothetical protein
MEDRVTKSAFERQAEQMRSQIDAMLSSMEDLQRNYNRWVSNPSQFFGQAGVPVSQAARTARRTVENASEELSHGNFPWWVPVAAIGVIGAAVWIYNMLSPRVEHEITHEARHAMHQMRQMGSEMTGTQTGNREQFPQHRTGEQSQFGTQMPPSTPGQP